jgi:hypothetical protein
MFGENLIFMFFFPKLFFYLRKKLLPTIRHSPNSPEAKTAAHARLRKFVVKFALLG